MALVPVENNEIVSKHSKLGYLNDVFSNIKFPEEQMNQVNFISKNLINVQILEEAATKTRDG